MNISISSMNIPIALKNITANMRSKQWVQDLLDLGNVYIVGGTVRDAYMDRKIKDIDLIVEGPNIHKIKLILAIYGRVDEVGKSFAVIKFRPHGHVGEDFDIAVPREDTKIGGGHQGFSINTNNVTLEDDLLRRDFTINSMAINIKTDELIDPFYGLGDIRNGLIRATDFDVFSDDPLRILRGVQFAARFGFRIESMTLCMMREKVHLINEISGERIFDELIKILRKNGNTQIAIDLIHNIGIDYIFFNREIKSKKNEFSHLDEISFFYLLGVLGAVDPADFLKNRLKADNRLVLNVKTLGNIFKKLPDNPGEEDLKVILFKAFSKSPDIMKVVIFPDEIKEIIYKMRSIEIPGNWEDIQIDGNDIKNISGINEGPEIGLIKERILRDALMNRFNWKYRKDSLEYLKNLCYDK